MCGSLHQHYGKENRVINNIFAYSATGQLIRSRQEEHTSFFLEHNIIFFNNDRLLGSNWDKPQYQLDNNCYWDTSTKNIDFNGKTFREWQASGQDVHSIVADPLFVDPEKADFTLKPGSPALLIGFRPIDTRAVGLYGETEWTDKAQRVARAPFSPPAPPEPFRMTIDFDAMNVGSSCPDLKCSEEGEATIRVSDETAVSGKNSLKITDAAGLKNAFDPHMYVNHLFRKGYVTGSFWIRFEPGVVS